MRKFVVSLLGFALFAFAGYSLLLLLAADVAPKAIRQKLNYNKGTYGQMQRRLIDANSSKNIDILFLGSSHAYRGFDTRIFSKAGYSSFNLGSSSQTPLQTMVLLERYLDRMHPKLVVCEMYPMTFEIDGVESSMDLLSSAEMDFDLVKMSVTQNSIRVYNALIYNSGRSLLGNSREAKQTKGDRYVAGGFIEGRLHYFNASAHRFEFKKWDFNDRQLEDFKKILTLLKQKGCHILLVQAPVTQKLSVSYTNSRSVDSLFSTLGDYHNFNGKVILNDSLDFADSNHLNQNGVVKFNDAVLELIRSKNLVR